MIVYLPEDTIDKCVAFMTPGDQIRTAISVLQVTRVIHEEDQLTNMLRDHPAVLMWHGFEQYLITYGLALTEAYLKVEPQSQTANTTYTHLERHFELATTSDYEPDVPGWMGNEMMHQRFKRALITESPHMYYKHYDEVGHWDMSMFMEPS